MSWIQFSFCRIIPDVWAHGRSWIRIRISGPGAGRRIAPDQAPRLLLVESVGKKCAFLRAAIQAADLPAKVIQGRVEAINPVQADCVTARAFAPLPKLIEYAEPWFRQGAIWRDSEGSTLGRGIDGCSGILEIRL